MRKKILLPLVVVILVVASSAHVFSAPSQWQNPAVQDGPYWYTIRSGDTLYKIALRYGTTVEDIMRANNYWSSWIYPGQVFLIPAWLNSKSPNAGSAGVMAYTVKPGDTLYLLSKRFGTTVEAIMRASNWWSNWIYPGQRLWIPSSIERGVTEKPSRGGDPRPPVPPANPPSLGGTNPSGPPVTPPVPGDTNLPAPQPPIQVRPGSYQVLGYYAEDWAGDIAGYDSLTRYYRSIDAIGSFQYRVDASGNLMGENYQRMMDFARSKGIKLLALIHNYMGGFNREIAHSVLANSSTRARFIDNIFKLLRDKGFAGVNIDLENVDPGDREHYTQFVKELAARLKPAGYLVTLSIPAKTGDDPYNGWSGGFDYKALGQYADQIMVMTYDEHWSGGPAGPIASLGWVEQVARYAVSQIPSNKVMLGIAAYGYDWIEGTSSSMVSTYAQTMEKVARYGGGVQWDNTAQVPFYRYNNGANRIIYFEDARSTSLKLDLVLKYNLGGIAIWRLGQEDPAIWPLIDKKLR